MASKKLKISVALATFNEEAAIKDCLESVKWADEIVIVDGKSSDGTVAIARKYTQHIIEKDNDPLMFHKNKQLAVENCKGEWIFSIDADERASEDLRGEIVKVANSEGIAVAYQCPRQNIIFGKWMQHTGWYPDYQVKLFKKGRGHYPCKSLHEQIEIDGEIGTLKSDLVHSHYVSVTQFIDRLNKYTSSDARYLLEKGETIVWSDAIRFPAEEFFKRFFLWHGYKDGLHGLTLSLLQSLSRLVVFAKIWEEQKFWQYGGDTILPEVEHEISKINSDYHFWLASVAVSPFKKLKHKIRRKISF